MERGEKEKPPYVDLASNIGEHDLNENSSGNSRDEFVCKCSATKPFSLYIRLIVSVWFISVARICRIYSDFRWDFKFTILHEV